MTAVNSANYSSILNQIQSITAQGVSGGSSLGGLSFGDIWSANAYFEQLSNGNGEQKAQAAQGLIQKAMSLIKTLQAQRASEAKTAEQDTNSQTQKAQNDQNKTEADAKKDTDAVNADAEQNQSDIEAAKDEQNAVQEEQKKEAEKIEEKHEKIEDNKQDLKAADTPAEQERVLGEIAGDNDELGEASGALQKLEEDAGAVNASLEDAAATSAVIQERGAEVTANTQQQLGAVATEYANVAAKAGERSVKAIEDKVVETAAQQTASSPISMIPGVGAGVQAYVEKIVLDAGQSANINSGTAVKAGGAVAQAAPELVTDVHQLSDFAYNFVGSMNQQNDLIGEINSKLSPIISGIGQTVDSTSDVNKTLGSAVQNDLAQAQSRQTTEQAQPTQQGTGITPQEGTPKEGTVQPTETENVDISTLKQAKVPEN